MNFSNKTKLLIAGVVLAHIALIFTCGMESKIPIKKTLPQKVVVTTIALAPKKILKEQSLSSPISGTSIPLPPTEAPPPKIKPREPLPPTPQAVPVPPSPKITKPPAPNPDPKPATKPVVKPVAEPKPAAKKESQPKPPNKPNAPPAKDKKTTKKIDEKKPPASTLKASPIKPSPLKPPAPTPKKEPGPTWTKEQEALLKSVQESISSLEFSPASSSKTTTVAAATYAGPKQIAQLGIEQNSFSKTLESMEKSYQEELSSRLKLLLKMPEIGEIKILLTIEREGKIIKLAITHADSEKNRHYVEKSLPSLTMPTFGNRFKDKSQHTFSITLSNE